MAKRKKQTKRAITRRYNRNVKMFGKAAPKVRKLIKSRIVQLQADLEASEAAKEMMEGDLENLRERIHAMEREANRKQYPIWKTGRGESIAVNQLEEGHLRNAISYCTRRVLSGLGNTVYLHNIQYLIEGLSNLMKEAERRGIRV